jgi:CubicO group peptidase (beta-lactamase class C family)
MGYSAKAEDYADARVRQVTIRQLLQNHAGWTIDRSQDPMFERVPPCPGRAARWLGSMKLDAEPGQLYSYSNINFCLAQLAIEKVTGQKYEDFVKSQIATPVGIKSWEFATLRSKSDEPEYVMQSGDKGSPYTNLDFEALGGAGAWTSTASDYARFLNALRAYRGVTLLSAASLAQLYARPAAAASATAPSFYSLGVRTRVFDNNRFTAWHSGSLPGTSTTGLSYSNGWVVVAFFNSRVPGSDRQEAVGDTDRLLGQAAGKSKPPAGELPP